MSPAPSFLLTVDSVASAGCEALLTAEGYEQATASGSSGFRRLSFCVWQVFLGTFYSVFVAESVNTLLIFKLMHYLCNIKMFGNRRAMGAVTGGKQGL